MSAARTARVHALADATLRRMDPARMRWDWGEGLLLYALARLGETRAPHRAFVAAYFDRWLRRGIPAIDWSDRCAPGLAAAEMYRLTGDAAYRALADRISAYLSAATPTRAGALNHFGTSRYARFYPTSMWVDSLMMYAVFAARWGRVTGDRWPCDFAAAQALALSRALVEPSTQLWKHAYVVGWHRTIPRGDVYWLRGNGWAVAGLAAILEALPPQHESRESLRRVLESTAGALLAWQRESGLWSTVLNRDTYEECSGSALIAFGLATAVRRGELPARYRAAAERAFSGVVASLEERADGLSLPGISGATMPYPFLGYALIPRRRDLPHGLAALILAATEFEQ